MVRMMIVIVKIELMVRRNNARSAAGGAATSTWHPIPTSIAPIVMEMIQILTLRQTMIIVIVVMMEMVVVGDGT